MLGQMLELAMILRRRRFARGALELNLPEVEIDAGRSRARSPAPTWPSHDESHQVIEEFMLAANEAVATHLTEQQIGFLRRAHPDPEPFKLDEFAEFARSLGLTHRPAAEPVRAPANPRTRPPASPRNTPSTTGSCGA